MELLDVDAASRRLGVRPQTLYAYVSRGIIASHRGADGRTSWFTSADVERLAARGRPRRATQQGAIDLTIETHLTELDDRCVRFRGHDVADLATTRSFEETADLLWGERAPQPWPGRVVGVDRRTGPAAIRTIVAELIEQGSQPPTASETAAAGRLLIASIVDSLPLLGDARTPRLHLGDTTPRRGSIAGRLWPRLTARRARPSGVATLNAAMVLAADHELAASTLAVRVAASTWAPPAAAVLSGLGAMAGPLHGSASAAARQLIDDCLDVGVERSVASWLEGGRRLAGFGHRVYVSDDPRSVVLLDLLRRAEPGRTVRIVDELIEVADARTGQRPNIDLALAAMGVCFGMPPDAGEVVMSTARIAGWLAHAIEEYGERPLRFRTRAAFRPS